MLVEYSPRFVGLLMTLLAFMTSCKCDVNQYAPKPGEFKRLDKPTNKTIDQLITEALGGIDVASNKILAPGSYVLAELDMYLSQQQFLALYEPPSQNLIISSENDAPVYLTGNKRRSLLDVLSPQTPHLDARKDVDPPPSPKSTNVMPNKNDLIPWDRQKRKAMRDVILRWPRAEIPYHLAFGDFTDQEVYLIKQAMTEWERYTCIKFRPAATNDVNLVRFQNGEGCISQLGMVGGVQVLTLDKEGCRFKGLYLHEIGHALGLVHEHQLPDRDAYIDILMQNVAPHFRVFFSKYSSAVVNQYNVPYEYSSVMHYGITAFSYNAQAQTIRAKDPSKEESIGRVYLKELSFSDVKVVNGMYGCADACPGLVTCTGDGYMDQNCRCVCPDGTNSCEISNVKTSKKNGDDTKEDGTNKSDSGVMEESCANLYDNWKCTVWANQGECERNPHYMKKSCRKACGLCDKKETKEEETKNHFTTWAWQWFGMFTNLFPKDWMIGVCKDVYTFEKCNKWMEQGDCVTNAGWMEANCKMTCNFCGNPAFRPQTNCRNHHDEDKCDKWALEGECVLNERWMRINCQRSCRACVDTLDTEPDGDGRKDKEEDCVDEHGTKDCKIWAKAGECYINPNWMIANCRKSCDKCNDGSCKDLYEETQCQVWAQEMECLKNRVWMHNNCMKSCGLCQSNATGNGTSTGTGNNGTGNDESSGTTGRKNDGTSGRDENGKSGTGTDDTGKSGSGNKDSGRVTTRRPNVVTPSQRPNIASTTVEPDTATCYNSHNNVECQNWASINHCDINPTWMYPNCKKACGQCDSHHNGQREECVDRDEGCEAWAKTGFCETNAGYNLIFCKKSCDNCNGCRDEQFLCGLWAKAGHCHSNARYMLRQCQKSCNTCGK